MYKCTPEVLDAIDRGCYGSDIIIDDLAQDYGFSTVLKRVARSRIIVKHRADVSSSSNKVNLKNLRREIAHAAVAWVNTTFDRKGIASS